MTRITLIDNYDSFTFNLFHDLGKLGADVTVIRNDDITTDALIASSPDAIVLSPGPGTPDDSGICLETIEKASKTIPILVYASVCKRWDNVLVAMLSAPRYRCMVNCRPCITREKPSFAGSMDLSKQRATIL